MSIVSLKKGDTAPIPLLASSVADIQSGKYDGVVLVLSGPNSTECRWSNMTMKDLVFLHRVLGAAIDRTINDAET